MRKQLTVTLEDEVYDGLIRAVGHENISQFINGLVRPHVLKSDLEAGYRATAADEAREAEVAARVAAIDEGYGMFAGRGRGVDEFLDDRHAEGEADYLKWQKSQNERIARRDES